MRTKFFKAIIEIYQELTSFSFQHDEQPGDITVEPAEPEYIPEGFKKASTEKLFTIIFIIYTNDDGEEIIFDQTYITNDKIKCPKTPPSFRYIGKRQMKEMFICTLKD